MLLEVSDKTDTKTMPKIYLDDTTLYFAAALLAHNVLLTYKLMNNYMLCNTTFL